MTDPGVILLPYQQRWMEDGARVRVYEKSRRIGISWDVACESTLDASERDGCDTWFISYNKDMSKEFIRDCAGWAKHFGAVGADVGEEVITDEDKEILTFFIRFRSGFRVTALSSRPTNLRYKKGHIVIDEAAHHDDLDGLLKAAMAVFMWGGRSRVDIISTHNGVDNAFNKLVTDIKAGRLDYSLHRTTIDDALEEGLYKRICLVNGDEWSKSKEARWRAWLFGFYGDSAREELLCIPSRSGGVYISRDLIEKRMSRDGVVVRLTLPSEFVLWSEEARTGHVEQWLRENVAQHLTKFDKDLLSFFGEDFGRVSDRTVIALGQLTQQLTRKFPLAIELCNVPFDQQRQILFYVVDALPRFFAGALDSTGNGSYLAEAALQRYGENYIHRVELSDSWYSANLPPFKASFEDATIELVMDADHMLDLAALQVINGVPKLPKAKTKSATHEGPPRHGDAAIAYVLGDFASRQPIATYTGYQSATRRQLTKSPSSRGISPRLSRGGH